MAELKKDPLEAFRDGLTDVIAVIDKLSPFCGSIDEMRGIVELALSNDAQTRILFSTMTQGKK